VQEVASSILASPPFSQKRPEARQTHIEGQSFLVCASCQCVLWLDACVMCVSCSVCLGGEKKKKRESVLGLEPRISCSVGRRLIHWAIRTSIETLRTRSKLSANTHNVPRMCHNSLGVEHSLSKRKVVGSNPACGFLTQLFCGYCFEVWHSGG
jgi:hypothetical protein